MAMAHQNEMNDDLANTNTNISAVVMEEDDDEEISFEENDEEEEDNNSNINNNRSTSSDYFSEGTHLQQQPCNTGTATTVSTTPSAGGYFLPSYPTMTANGNPYYYPMVTTTPLYVTSTSTGPFPVVPPAAQYFPPPPPPGPYTPMVMAAHTINSNTTAIGTAGCAVPPPMMDPIQAQLAQARMLAHYATQLANNIQQQIDLSQQQQPTMVLPMHPNVPPILMGNNGFIGNYSSSFTSTDPQSVLQRYPIPVGGLEEDGNMQHPSVTYTSTSTNYCYETATTITDPHTASRQRSRDRQRYQQDDSQPNKRRQKIHQQLQQQQQQQPQQSVQLQPKANAISIPTPLFSIRESSSTITQPSPPTQMPQGPQYSSRQSNSFSNHRLLGSGGEPQKQKLLYQNTTSTSSNKRRISQQNHNHSHHLLNASTSHNSINNTSNNHGELSTGGHGQQQQQQQQSSQYHRKRIGGGKKYYYDMHPTSPRPLNLIGKTGVMALHELCSKFHWDPPRFVEVTATLTTDSPSTDCNIDCQHHTTSKATPTTISSSPTQYQHKSKRKLTTTTTTATTTITTSQSATSVSSSSDATTAIPTTTTTTPIQCHEFLIHAYINASLYGSGRGGTKAAARQEAARKALAELLPGITFDVNGIVLKMPSAYQHREESQESPSSVAPTASPSACDDYSSSSLWKGNTKGNGMASCAKNNLGPSNIPRPSLLNHVVAINHNNNNNNNNNHNMNLCYPSSGISSASEDDENSYYASRGASVCSSLLHGTSILFIIIT